MRRRIALLLLGAVLAMPVSASPFTPVGEAPADTVPADELSQSTPLATVEGNWVRLQSNIAVGRAYSQAVYASAEDEVFFFGGKRQSTLFNDLWRIHLRPTAYTQVISAGGVVPAPRWGHSAVYDAARNRILIFGGSTSAGETLTNQLWQLTLGPNPTWTLLVPEGTPPPTRYGHRAVYDSARDRMIVFGGYHTDYLNDVWELSLSPTLRWSEVSPTGPAPDPRLGAAAVYDPAFDRMVIYGGLNTSNLGDTWELAFQNGATWSPIATGGLGPPVRAFSGESYDVDDGGMWLFGGLGATTKNDTWFLRLDADPQWTQIFPAGTPPTARSGHSMVLDPLEHRLVVFNGSDLTSVVVSSLRVEPSPTWSVLFAPAAEPAPRYAPSFFFHPPSDRLILFGGGSSDAFGTQRFNDSWSMDLSTTRWSALSPLGTLPSKRFSHASAYDSRRDQEFIFGGFDNMFESDLWSLSLSGPGTWTALHPTGSIPPSRDASALNYDPLADRLILFGGYNDSYLNDVSTLALGGPLEWISVIPTGPAISARSGFGSAYDGNRHSIWVFGGQVATNLGVNDVWRLSLDGAMQWIPITVSGTPPAARWGTSLVYDSARDRLLVFGGVDRLRFYNDIWELSLSGVPAWKQITPMGTPPSPRDFAGVAFDPTRSWLIVNGGIGQTMYGDTWAWSMDQPVPALASWVDAKETPQGMRLLWLAPSGTLADIERRTDGTDWTRIATQFADESQRVLYVDGSIEPGTRYGYRLRIGEETYGDAWVQTSSRTLQLAGLSSNPGTRGSTIGFTLVGAGEARIQMIDPRGRVVFAREVGAMGPGPHSIGIAGASIHPGVYWIRLAQGAETRTVKAVLF